MEICLDFPKTVTALVGYEYGEKIYKQQVKDKICWQEHNVIIFPDEITSVAISFVQGFYNEIVKNLGFDKAAQVEIRASSPELIKKIRDSILSIV